jgi:hypothetical protein
MVPVLVNGQNLSAIDVNLVVLGVLTLAIDGIEYDYSQESPNHYGLGAEPISYSRGKVMYKGGKMRVMFDTVRQIVQQSPIQNMMNIPPSTISINYGSDGVIPGVINIKNVRFTGNPFAVKAGDTAIWINIPFEYAGIDATNE